MLQIWKVWIGEILHLLGLSKQEDSPVHQTICEARPKYRSKKVEAKEKKKVLTQVLQPAYTQRLRPEPEEAVFSEIDQRAERIAETSLLSWYGLTDTGIVRPHNEDNLSCLAFADSTLFVVADGMGGHEAGEVASKIAVDTVCQEVREGVAQKREPLSLIEHAVQQANTAVQCEGKARGASMGTTLSIAYVTDSIAYIANVGDSRVYWVENGTISQITEDHSLVAKLVAAGKLTKEDARQHPKSNLLYRTVGTDDVIKVDTFRVGLRKGGSLLLCTDGLWGMVPDKELHTVCSTEKNIKKVCARLVKKANENGGLDNITAVVVKVV
jgi:serine/threonine protein phosphatase PrpC